MTTYIRGPALLREVFDVCASLQYPASTEYAGTPTVVFMPTDLETSFEQVAVMGVVEDSEIDWVLFPSTLEERLLVTIEIRSWVPGVEGPDALVRADTISRVVQDGFRDSTGLPAGLTAGTNLQGNWRFSSAPVQSGPLADGGTGVTITLKLRLIAYR